MPTLRGLVVVGIDAVAVVVGVLAFGLGGRSAATIQQSYLGGLAVQHVYCVKQIGQIGEVVGGHLATLVVGGLDGGDLG
nr:hypothetical protein [Mycobacteroides abscessus]